METTTTDGRKVRVVLDSFGRAFIEGEETYLRLNRKENQIMADPRIEDGEFVTIDNDGNFKVWDPPPGHTTN